MGRKPRAAVGHDAISRRRNGGAHRSRQERARARADRDRSRSAEGREGARDHDRPRVRAPGRSATSTSRSSTFPATSASSRTCWRARRDRPGRARRRRRRVGDAADARALRHLPAAQRAAPALVALTKSDLADADMLELARSRCASSSPARFSTARRSCRCRRRPATASMRLRAALAGASRRARGRAAATASPRLPIDRVFTMKGFGTVVTGTLVSGRIARRRRAAWSPRADGAVKVRGVQVHGVKQPHAVAGQRSRSTSAASRSPTSRAAIRW